MDILYQTPSYILNKMARDNIGPFEICKNSLNERYSHWNSDDTDDTYDTDDTDDPDDIKYYINPNFYNKKYMLDTLRLDIFQKNIQNEWTNNESIYSKDLSDVDSATIYSNKFNIHKKIWRFNHSKHYEREKYDSYWSIYENRLYESDGVNEFNTYTINERIKEYRKDTINIGQVVEQPEEEQPEEVRLEKLTPPILVSNTQNRCFIC